VIAGDTRSEGVGDSDAWVIKVDLEGNLVWERTCGGNGFDTPTCITVSSEGTYVLAGTTFSSGNGNRDFWLFELGGSGEELLTCTIGRSGYEEAYGVMEAEKDEFFLAGWTNSVGEGRYDFYGVKIAVKP